MSLLHLARRLPVWVVVAVLLAWGQSMAAPLFKPLTLSTVCRGSGAIVTVLTTDQGTPDAPTHDHGDCGRCVPSDASAPPLTPPGIALQRNASVPARFPVLPVFHQRLVPSPARGPPVV